MGIAQALATAKFYLLRMNPYSQLFNIAMLLSVNVAVRGWELWYALFVPVIVVGLWFEYKHSIRAETKQIWEKNAIWMAFQEKDAAHKQEVEQFMREVRAYMEAHP